MRRSCGWRCRRSGRSSPSRCSCSPTPPSSAASAPSRSAAWASPARRSRRWSASRSSWPTARRRPSPASSEPGHRDAAIRQGIDGLWLAAAIGLAVLAVGWPLAPQIAAAFGGTPAVSHEAVIYLRVSLLGAPSMLAVLAGTGVLRGLQDTRTPLLVAIAANALNIGLNATFVLGLHWGIAGSAAGTVIAQTGSGCRLPGRRGAAGRTPAGIGMRPDRAGHQVGGVRRRVTGAANASAPGSPGDDDRDRGPAVGRRHRCPSGGHADLEPVRLRPRRDRDRRAGDHRAPARRRRRRRGSGRDQAHDRLGRRLRRAVLDRPAGDPARAARPVRRLARGARASCCPSCSSSSCSSRPPASCSCSTACSSGRAIRITWPSRAWSRSPSSRAAAAIVVRTGGGLVALWIAYTAWMLARLVTLTLRTRSSRWLVTGAVRH